MAVRVKAAQQLRSQSGAASVTLRGTGRGAASSDFQGVPTLERPGA